MKIDKRIILYLDNQLSEDERRIFEIELGKSSELSKKVELYQNMMKGLKVDEQNLADEEYFVNLIPKFRKNLPEGKKLFINRNAYALTAAAVVIALIFILFNPFKTSENNSVDGLISTFNEQEAAEVLDYYSNNLTAMNVDQLNGSSDSLFVELISSELDFQASDLKKIARSDINYLNDIYSELQSEEVDVIYNEILKTKFF